MSEKVKKDQLRSGVKNNELSEKTQLVSPVERKTIPLERKTIKFPIKRS